jgi:WD40 repeat protein
MARLIITFLCLLLTVTGCGPAPRGQVNAVALSHNGRWLLAANNQKGAVIWEIETGIKKKSIDLLDVSGALFSLDDKFVYLCAGGRVGSWDVETGIEKQIAGPVRPGYLMTFSADQKILATTVGTSAITMDADCGIQKNVFIGHNQAIISFYISYDGKLLATGSEDQTVRLWDVGTGKQLHVFTCQGEVMSVAISANNKWLIAADKGTVRMWEILTGNEFRKFEFSSDSTNLKGLLLISPDDAFLYTALGSSVASWKLADGSKTATFSGHTRPVWSMTISGDGKRLATGGFWPDLRSRIWDAETGKEIAVFE